METIKYVASVLIRYIDRIYYEKHKKILYFNDADPYVVDTEIEKDMANLYKCVIDGILNYVKTRMVMFMNIIN